MAVAENPGVWRRQAVVVTTYQTDNEEAAALKSLRTRENNKVFGGSTKTEEECHESNESFETHESSLVHAKQLFFHVYAQKSLFTAENWIFSREPAL